MQRKLLFHVSLLALFLVSSSAFAGLNDDLDKPVAKGGGTVKDKVLERIQKSARYRSRLRHRLQKDGLGFELGLLYRLSVA